MHRTLDGTMQFARSGVSAAGARLWRRAARLARAVGEKMAPPVPPVGTPPASEAAMSRTRYDILVCPVDKGPLELVDAGRYLLNPRNGYRYPVRDGLPVMLVAEGRAHRIPVTHLSHRQPPPEEAPACIQEADGAAYRA